MKGPSKSIAAIPVLMVTIIVSNIAQLAALSPEETCPLVKNNTYIADPNNCQGWVLCLNGNAIYGKCNGDFLYDSASGVCDYPENVACTVDVKTMCAGLTDIYKPDPNNCQNYCYCNEGTTYTAKCPDGQHYNPTTTSCVWAQDSKCVANSPCLLAQNGFIKDANSCDGWIRCGSGQILSSGKCPSNRYYNPNNGMCDYPQNVQCSTTGPVGPGPSVPTTPNPPTGVCSTGKKFNADGKTCRGYFVCQNDIPTWGQCPKGSNFDADTEECVDPEKVACTDDRCDGSSKLFMAVASTKCNEYYNCKNGAQTGTGKCPADYPNFNELAGVCQATALTYKVCSS